MRTAKRRGRPWALVIAVALGCGDSALTETASPTGVESNQAEAGGSQEKASLSGFIATTEVFNGDFDGMAERRVIRLLTTFSRTSYFLDAGRPRGTTAEAAKMLEDFVNERLGTGRQRVYVVVYPVRRDEIIPALLAGHADIASANLTITEKRLESVAFGDPFLTGVKEVVVTGPKAPSLESLEDLAGREIWVRPSSSFHESLSALSDRFVREGKQAIDIRAADELLETEDLLQMVSSGMLPMTVADSHLADFWGSVLEDLEVRSDLAISEDREIAWAFRKNSPELEEVVNDFVAKHKKGTLLGNILIRRYFRDNEWVRDPRTEIDRFELHRPSFEKYALQYELDWLLTAAQGYQESHLDQSKRSHAGAVGVMQIKPSTAADPNVGIEDISTAEANIHAGIKYLRFLHERYFSQGAMTRLNQGLFSLAAYNAGPARLRRIRKEASEKGLDPNVWFRNVEQLAPGETRQYVSNVYKYYITYREYLGRQESR